MRHIDQGSLCLAYEGIDCILFGDFYTSLQNWHQADMSAVITSWTPVGGIFKHVEYKIEVNLDGALWEIYRRYANFVGLDKGLRSILGESFIAQGGFNPELPGKELPHYVNPGAVHKRVTGLNEYLQAIVTFVPPEKHKDASRRRNH